PLGRCGAGRAHLQAHAAACEPRGAVQRGDRSSNGRVPRQLPAGVHAHCPDQHRALSGMGPSKSLIRGVAAVFVLAACGAGGGSAPPPLTLAATTTLEDSGLLAELVAAFRAA